MYHIQNEMFCLDISEIGAEIVNLRINQINILWHKNELWDHQSPILFPIIGSLKDDHYIYEGKKYTIPMHGFMMTCCFTADRITDHSIRLSTRYTNDTLKMYPFKYEFHITYRLEKNTLKIFFEVINLDQKEMYFSLGIHPGFDYQGLKTLLGENFELSFSPKNVQSVDFDPSYVKDVREEDISRKTLKDLSLELSRKKTLCYRGLQNIELKFQTKTLKIQNGMPYMAFWQKNPDQPEFLCIESWWGLPDEHTTNHQLCEKPYLQKLESQKKFQTKIEISFNEEAKS